MDSCLVIYLVEEHEVFGPKLVQLVDRESKTVFVVSELTKMECLILPVRQSDEQLIGIYRAWFGAAVIAELNTEIFETATILRAENARLKTPDAIHIATAADFGCDEFWTNDKRLPALAQLTIVNLTDEKSNA